MTNKTLILLASAAVLLGGAAYFVGKRSNGGAPQLNGRAILPNLAIGEVASIAFGDALKVRSGEGGWTVETYHGYPADRSKLSDALIRLSELKVGQVVRGKDLARTTDLILRDATGRELVKLPLGERHAKWGHGRYAAFKGRTVLVTDALEVLEGNGKSLVETKIVDAPAVSFNEIVENVPEAELGFSTGVVARVTIAGDTNRTVTVGNAVKGGTDRYLKLDRSPWVFQVPAYAVESLLPPHP